VVDDVVDGQADQAGVLRYSDDHHIVRELGEPRHRTGPQHTQPEWPGPGQIPASEHPGPGPAAAYPARAGLRAAEPRPLRPEAHSPRPARHQLAPAARARPCSTGPTSRSTRPGPARSTGPALGGPAGLAFLFLPGLISGLGPAGACRR